MSDEIHCDDLIDDESQPECLRKFLRHVRSPCHGALLDTPRPKLFADYEGKRMRVTFASRLGDFGISRHHEQEHGYQKRVDFKALSNFSASAARKEAGNG